MKNELFNKIELNPLIKESIIFLHICYLQNNDSNFLKDGAQKWKAYELLNYNK